MFVFTLGFGIGMLTIAAAKEKPLLPAFLKGILIGFTLEVLFYVAFWIGIALYYN